MTESNQSETTNATAESLGISSDLLAILVCPVDHGELEVAPGSLRCTVCQHVYPVEDGIPNMVVDTNGKVER